MPGRLSGSSIHLFYILRHKVFPDCMGISVEVEDYAWIRRIVEKENLARSSSDCVVISGEVEACTRICVERGESGRWRETCRWVGVPGR